MVWNSFHACFLQILGHYCGFLAPAMMSNIAHWLSDYINFNGGLEFAHLVGHDVAFAIHTLGLFICQSSSDFQISNSFEKLRSFWIQICKAFFSKPLFRGRAFDLNFCTTPKENTAYLSIILFSDNVLVPNHEGEIIE